MCKVTTDVGGLIKVIPWLSTCMGDNYLLKLGDYLNVEEDKPWYNYYLMYKINKKRCHKKLSSSPEQSTSP